MQLKYGSYAFDANAVKVATFAETLWNEGGQPYAVRKRIDVDGYLSADGQTANSTAASALATALALPYRDLILYQDDAAESATSLKNDTSIDGVKIVDGPNFPDSNGGEYSTFRRFTFSAQAEYPIANTDNILLSFRERLSFSGGGPRYAMGETVNTLPQRQLLYPATIYRVVQAGSAVGYRRYPTPPRPLWPAALKMAGSVDEDSPDRRGKQTPSYSNFPVTWRYEFESATALTGFPNLWIG